MRTFKRYWYGVSWSRQLYKPPTSALAFSAFSRS
jgi:hypothetical protein